MTYRQDYYQRERDRVLTINARSRAKHAEKVKEQKRAQYLLDKSNPEYVAKAAAYRLANKAKKREYDRTYRAVNKEKLDAFKTVWRAKNAAKVTAIKKNYKHRRRAAESGGDSTSKILKWEAGQPKICHWCSASCAGWHLDHVQPLARGGKHEIANLVISCPSCNLRKNALSPEEFVRRRAAA